MNLRSIIFDLDGTLADSKLDIARSQVVAMKAHGFCTTEADFLPLAGQPLHVAFRHLEPDLEPGLLNRMIESYRDHYWDHALDTTVLFPGVAEMLECLARSSVGIAIATTKGTRQARKVVDGLGLNRWVDAVFGTDPPLNYKPAPDLFLHAMASLGWTAKATLAVGDAPADLAAAHRAGCVAGAALWDTHDRSLLLAQTPAHAFERPEDVCEAALGTPIGAER